MTKQRLQTVGGLVFIDWHILPLVRRNTLLQPIEQDSSNYWMNQVNQQSKSTDEMFSIPHRLLDKERGIT